MLNGIDPLLAGELLAHLDAMGHSDGVVLADAHFPASRLADRLLVVPGAGTPEMLRAVRTVTPADDDLPLDLMSTPDGEKLDVHGELARAAGVDDSKVRHLPRHDFYDAAEQAFLVVRTGETRAFGNAIFRKGVVGSTTGG